MCECVCRCVCVVFQIFRAKDRVEKILSVGLGWGSRGRGEGAGGGGHSPVVELCLFINKEQQSNVFMSQWRHEGTRAGVKPGS